MARLSPGLRTLAIASRTLDAVAPDLASRIMLHHFSRPRRKPDFDYRNRLPAGAQPMVVHHDKGDLTGWCWGRHGPAALLVHGWEDHTGSMLPFVAPLVARGYRVFAFDAPGHGLSPRSPTDLLDCSRALESLAQDHGPFESIIAHSFGATAVSVMLARAPYLRPARMALVSPMRDMEQHLEVFSDIALLSPTRTARLRYLVAERIGCPPASVSAVDALRDLEIPGLIIHDRDDPVIPHAVGATLADAWRGAALFSTARLGHRGVLRCPLVLEAVMRFHDQGRQ